MLLEREPVNIVIRLKEERPTVKPNEKDIVHKRPGSQEVNSNHIETLKRMPYLTS